MEVFIVLGLIGGAIWGIYALGKSDGQGEGFQSGKAVGRKQGFRNGKRVGSRKGYGAAKKQQARQNRSRWR